MSYYRLMNVTAGMMLALGLALSSYGGMLVSFFDPAYIPQSVPEDAAAMSYWGGIAFMRMFGVMLIGVGVLAWLMRNITSIEAQQPVVIGLFVLNTLGFLMALAQQVAIWNKAVGWLAVAVFLMLAAGFGYRQFVSMWRRNEVSRESPARA